VNRAPRPRSGAGRLRCAVLSVLLLSAVACNERPADLREWRASDHDHTDSPTNAQVQVDPKEGGTAVPGLEDVTIVAWQQNCTRCHGQLGRGDGPQGAMLKATNLSDPTWQGSVTDEHIAGVIKTGKGAMPPSNLPDGTIANLVKLVRMMNAARLGGAGAAAAPSASASPAPSGAAPRSSDKAAAAPKPSLTKPPAPAASTP
jgi:mono/diheme cytochrome c family protein